MCDFETPKFHREEVRKARKKYHCGECLAEILPKEIYTYILQKSSDGFFQHRMCQSCANAWKRIADLKVHFCTPYEELWSYDFAQELEQ